MSKHPELESLIKKQEVGYKPTRKMITCSEATHTKLTKIAHEIGQPLSKTVGLLVAFYLEEDLD